MNVGIVAQTMSAYKVVEMAQWRNALVEQTELRAPHVVQLEFDEDYKFTNIDLIAATVENINEGKVPRRLADLDLPTIDAGALVSAAPPTMAEAPRPIQMLAGMIRLLRDDIWQALWPSFRTYYNSTVDHAFVVRDYEYRDREGSAAGLIVATAIEQGSRADLFLAHNRAVATRRIAIYLTQLRADISPDEHSVLVYGTALDLSRDPIPQIIGEPEIQLMQQPFFIPALLNGVAGDSFYILLATLSNQLGKGCFAAEAKAMDFTAKAPDIYDFLANVKLRGNLLTDLYYGLAGPDRPAHLRLIAQLTAYRDKIRDQPIYLHKFEQLHLTTDHDYNIFPHRLYEQFIVDMMVGHVAYDLDWYKEFFIAFWQRSLGQWIDGRFAQKIDMENELARANAFLARVDELRRRINIETIG